jgi:hypothetical protein
MRKEDRRSLDWILVQSIVEDGWRKEENLLTPLFSPGIYANQGRPTEEYVRPITFHTGTKSAIIHPTTILSDRGTIPMSTEVSVHVACYTQHAGRSLPINVNSTRPHKHWHPCIITPLHVLCRSNSAFQFNSLKASGNILYVQTSKIKSNQITSNVRSNLVRYGAPGELWDSQPHDPVR